MSGSSSGRLARSLAVIRCGTPTSASAAAIGGSWAFVRASTATAAQRPPGRRSRRTSRAIWRASSSSSPATITRIGGPSARIAVAVASMPSAARTLPGGGDDGRSAAVVAVEADHPHPRIGAFDLLEQSGVCAVPAVDRLPGVADDRQVGAPAAELLEQCVLERVHVLELVDEQVAVPPPRRRGEVVVAPQLGDEPGEQVVEVDHPAGPLELVVAGEQVGDRVVRDREPSSCRLRCGAVVLRRDQPRPCPVDLGEHLRRVDRSARTGGARPTPACVGQELVDEPGPVGDQPRWAAVEVGPAQPEHRVGDGVERAGRDRVAFPSVRRRMRSSRAACRVNVMASV